MTVLQINPAASIQYTQQGATIQSPLGNFQLSGSDVGIFVQKLLPLVDGTRSSEELVQLLPDHEPQSILQIIELLQQKQILEEVIQNDQPISEKSAPFKIDLNRFKAFETTGKDALQILKSAHITIFGLESWAINAAIELALAGVGKLTLFDDQPLSKEESAAINFAGNKFVGTQRHEIARRIIEDISQGKTTVESSTIPAEYLATQTEVTYPISTPAPSLILNAPRYDELLLRYQTSNAAHSLSVPSLSAHIESNELWLGPFTDNDESACWNCLRMRRLAMDDQIAQAHTIQSQLMSQRPPQINREGMIPIAAEAGKLIAEETLKILLNTKSKPLQNRVKIHDLLKGQNYVHGLARLPWCPVCGGAQSQIDKARSKKIDLSRTKLEPAQDLPSLLSEMEGWLDPRLGVIRSLEITPTASPLPLTGTARLSNYTEGDPNRVAPGASCGGKGLSAFQAQVSSIGETVERYSAARYRDQDLTLAKIGDLKGDVIDPRQICLYDESVYQNPNNPYVPFDPNVPIRWVQGNWFGSTKKVWVPAIATYFGLQTPPEEQLLQVTSNGLAAGANSPDAALRAVFELIERDSTMLTWLCQLPAREVILDNSLDEKMRQTLAYMKGNGFRIRVYRLDVGTPIPVMFCLGFGEGRNSPSVAASLACHGDPRIAVDKALLEIAQVLPYLGTITMDKVPQTPEKVLTLEEHAFFYVPQGRESAFEFLQGKEPPLNLRDIPRNTFPTDPLEATKVIAKKLKEADLKIATVDVTSPDTYSTPFRVARAVGVHLQPIHFGYHLRPLNNPRLKKLLGNKDINPNPHPVA